MSKPTTVYPVYKNQFKIGAAEGSTTPIADMESFSVAFDGNVEEWTPMDKEGWVRRFMTGKGLTISIKGKRNVSDPGNNFVAGMAFAIGEEANAVLDWTFPDGTVVHIPCVVNVTNVGTGDSKNVGPLEFECLSADKPTVTPGA